MWPRSERGVGYAPRRENNPLCAEDLVNDTGSLGLALGGERCPAATNEPPWVNSPCSCTQASFDEEFRRFDYRKLEVESPRRTGRLQPAPRIDPKAADVAA